MRKEYDCTMETALPDSTGRSVYDVLSASRAMLERSCALGDGLRLAQWHKIAVEVAGEW